LRDFTSYLSFGEICADKVVTGAGESGKSTVLKQMKLIYAQGFSKSEKEEWRAIIFNNILSAFKVVLDAMEELGYDFENSENEVSRTTTRASTISRKTKVLTMT
jgi:hypothetical protein